MTNTPADQRRYRFERKRLRETAMRELADGGPFTINKGMGQSNKLRGLIGYLSSQGLDVETDETIMEYVLVLT